MELAVYPGRLVARCAPDDRDRAAVPRFQLHLDAVHRVGSQVMRDKVVEREAPSVTALAGWVIPLDTDHLPVVGYADDERSAFAVVKGCDRLQNLARWDVLGPKRASGLSGAEWFVE
jgi:hypothetical protein